MIKRSIFATALYLVAQQASAIPFEVDGDLKDWLAGAPTGQASDWTPRSDIVIKSMIEDQTGASTYLDPGWGGQAYDAEAVYVHRSTTHIHIAVVTGRAPGAGGYVAGDIAIDFGLDDVFDLGIVTLADGVGLGNTQGDLYTVSEWNYGLWSAPGVVGDPLSTEYGALHPASVKVGNKVGGVDLEYREFTYNGVGGDLGEYAGDTHYVIETAISLDLIGKINPDLLNQSFLVHWTMACANDFVEVDPPGASVPAPGPLALMLLGLLPLVRRSRNAA